MNSLLQLVKFNSLRQSHSVSIDFRQIYVRNVILFSTGLSMIRLLFGENIICLVTERGISQAFLDTKCFVNGTMTIGNPTIYHDYYQWVPVYLLLLAFGFYFPFSIWFKVFGHYVQDLESLAKKDDAIKTIRDSKGNWIFFKTWALELFYFIHTFLVLYLTNSFFNSLWSSLQWSWSAVYKIFPDSGSCYVTYFQSSGTTDGRYICLLPLCSVYRKIFVSLYGVFVVLIVLDVLITLARIHAIVKRGRCVNEWWAYCIVKNSTISWKDRKRLDLEFQRMITTETIV